MSVYYQTSPVASPPRSYYPWNSRRGSGYFGRGSVYGGSEYGGSVRPYNEYTGGIASPGAYGYYAPSTGYYQPGVAGQVVTYAQPQYTAPMAYSYLYPRQRLSRLYRGRSYGSQYYGYGYGNMDDGCCGCCGDDRSNAYGHQRDDGCCGAGCCGTGASYYGRRHRHGHRDDGCC